MRVRIRLLSSMRLRLNESLKRTEWEMVAVELGLRYVGRPAGWEEDWTRLFMKGLKESP